MKSSLILVRSRTQWHNLSCAHTSITPLSNSWNEAEEMFSQWFSAQTVLQSGLLSLCPLLQFLSFIPCIWKQKSCGLNSWPHRLPSDFLAFVQATEQRQGILLEYWKQRCFNEVQDKCTATSWTLITVDLCDAAVNTFHKPRWQPGRSTVIEKNWKISWNRTWPNFSFWNQNEVSNIELKVSSWFKINHSQQYISMTFKAVSLEKCFAMGVMTWKSLCDPYTEGECSIQNLSSNKEKIIFFSLNNWWGVLTSLMGQSTDHEWALV